MKPRLSCEWLHSCAGCEIALVDLGEGLLELLARVEIVHFPLLMDHKYAGRAGEGDGPELPAADLGLVSGGVASEEQRAILLAMRRSCRTLIALGTCATHGGIPALANERSQDAVRAGVFADCGPLPTEVPACLDRVYAVDEVVQPDLCVPGCPPRPEAIAAALTAVLDDELPATPAKSVCETCPARREGRAATRTARRFLDNADFDPDEELTHMRCLLEQGLLCMGPVTAGGCGGSGVPLCVRVRVPCRLQPAA
jgi:F420-non-reducing hydrogenase small subunit